MWSKVFITLLCLCCISATFAQQQKVKPIIFDSDMGPDYDDVGAITLLHAFADSGYIRILATVASTNYEGVAGVLNVFNTYFHRADLPIGVPKQNGLLLRDDQHWTDTLLARYPHSIRKNADAPDAVAVYREVLAAQPDHSVTIVSIGFFTNLAHLLQSKPDAYSSRTGAQLVQQKVKQLVSMAGKFPAGKEFNVAMDAGTAAFVFNHWPTNIIFSGFEIGEKIKVGLPLIHANNIQHSPVKDVFSMCIPMSKEDSIGRMSWDETAVLVACKGISPYYKLHSGSIVMHKDGSNGWSNAGKRQGYLVERVSFTVVRDYIDKMILHQPVKK